MYTVTQNCSYSNPVRYDGTTPTLPTHTFYFENIECDVVDNIPTTTNSSFSAGFNPTTTIASTSDVQVYGYFSAGEVLISFLLLCIVVLMLINLLVKALSNISTKKTYLQYGGGDVEIRKDL